MNGKFIFFLTSIIFLFGLLTARSFRVSELPNGGINRCANCHVNPAGGGTRNLFGQEVEANFLTAAGSAGHVIWNSDLAALDSDGDGWTNGEELQDPNGTWTGGDIGDPALVTNPGDPNSFPNPTSVDINLGLPVEYAVLQNYPNPFNPSTTIGYTLPEPADVSINIYSIDGQLISELVKDSKSAGYYEVAFDAPSINGLSSGTYFYRFSAQGSFGNISSVKKMLYIK